jgi:hypothetical protein
VWLDTMSRRQVTEVPCWNGDGSRCDPSCPGRDKGLAHDVWLAAALRHYVAELPDSGLRWVVCNSCKYSHGCDLPAGHGGEWHVCEPDEPNEGGFSPTDPHNTSCFAWRLDDPEAFECA